MKVSYGHQRLPHHSEDLLIALHRFQAGEVLPLLDPDARHRRAGKRRPDPPVPRHGHLLVRRRGQPVRVHERQLRRVRAGQRDAPPARGRHERGQDGRVLVPVLRLVEEQAAEVAHVAGGRDVLQLRPVGREGGEVRGGGGSEVRAEALRDLLPAEEVGDGVGERAGLVEGVGGGELAGRVGEVVGEFCEGREGDAVGGPEEDVVREVLAHAGAVRYEGDGVGGEVRGGPDAGEHEELRGLEGAGGEDHLFGGGEDVGEAGGGDAHAGGGFVGVEEDLGGEGGGVDFDVRAVGHGVQEGGLAGGALLVGGRDGARAVLAAEQGAAVEVLDAGDADLVERELHVRAEALRVVGVRDVEGSARRAECVGSVAGRGVRCALGCVGRREPAALLEIGQHAVEGPALVVDGIGPPLEAVHRRPLVDHKVPRGAPSQALAPGEMERPLVRSSLRLGHEAPVHQRVVVGDVRPAEYHVSAWT